MSELSDSPPIYRLNVVYITKYFCKMSDLWGLRLDKCQTPLLWLLYKESKKLLLKKGGNLMNDYLDYMDEIYEELVEEFGHEIESVCEHNHTNA
jgi:hypothetical protein